MGVLKKAKKKKIRKEIIEKAVTTKEIFKDENRKSKIMIMMSLSNLCKSYRNYFKIPKITDENLENGDTKIKKITEEQTLWCTFELEDVIQRSFRALTRLINEFEFEDYIILNRLLSKILRTNLSLYISERCTSKNLRK